MTHRNLPIATALLLAGLITTAAAQAPQPLAAEKRMQLERAVAELQDSLGNVPDAADAAIFQKGLEWALRYDQEFTPADVVLLEKAVVRCQERAAALTARESSWNSRRGRVARGYVSRVDGSVQPYGLIVPRDYDAARPMRLDVVLHGSTRPVGMSELRFIGRFDEGDAEGGTASDQPYLELHPLGRVENCYRWAGETDVFEAIEDVCRRYAVDRDRIVLRGMSMGASGTWHLGLKHPDRFVALGPYCGYVDTHRFSETPLPTFVKVGPLPQHQELGLHMLDSIDYAANAGIVPVIACMGEKDVFFQAHVLMGEVMRREGLTMINLISPGTGHVIDPVTHAEQMRQIGEIAEKGIDRQPAELRFVTWTLKYSRCHWLQLSGLEKHYARAELSARLRDERIEISEPQNITRFSIAISQLPQKPKTFLIGETTLEMPGALATAKEIVIARRDGAWQIAGESGKVTLSGKRPGLQGPIDDAFASPFLCVRGTGQPWNAETQQYADASLARFADEWRHYFRGELPVKDDTDVTAEDVRTKNLILFGDPGSNTWIAKTLPQLPLTWTTDTLSFGDMDYPSNRHLPALIVPSPLPGGEEHYIVLNSGHTFREAELAKLNYLLFPRWGDWAILNVAAPREGTPLTEEVVRAGYFDEAWKVPGKRD